MSAFLRAITGLTFLENSIMFNQDVANPVAFINISIFLNTNKIIHKNGGPRMADRVLPVTDAAEILAEHLSEPTLYRWIQNGKVAAERGPNGRIRVRESEVRRVLAWFNGEIVGDFQPPNQP